MVTAEPLTTTYSATAEHVTAPLARPTPRRWWPPQAPSSLALHAPSKRALALAVALSVTFAIGVIVGNAATPRHGAVTASEPSECISSVAAFEAAFAERVNSTAVMRQAACVAGSDSSEGVTGLMGAYDSSFSPRRDNDLQLKNQGGRRVFFAFGSDTLEKILVYGPRGGRAIVDSLSAGQQLPGPRYLLVWSASSERTLRPVSAWWENLEEFLRGVYGDALPEVAPAIETIRRQSFDALTGCDTAILDKKPTNLTGAGCSEAYKKAMELFPYVEPGNSSCTAEHKTYRGFETCFLAEQRFLELAQPSALELRAFLMQVNGFFPVFTGYGYTANKYPEPRIREYWLQNKPLRSLPSDRRFIPFEVL